MGNQDWFLLTFVRYLPPTNLPPTKFIDIILLLLLSLLINQFVFHVMHPYIT